MCYFSWARGGPLSPRVGALAPPRCVLARRPWPLSAWPRLGLPGPATAAARPRTWPGPSGWLWGVVSAGCRPSVAPGRCCSRFVAPAAPLSARQRVPGPAASAPGPGTPSRPGRPRPVRNRFLLFTPCRLREAQLRAAPGRRGLRPCADGRDPNYRPEIRGSRFPYLVHVPRFGRLLPVAADSFASLGASCASLFSCFWPRGSRRPTTSVAPPRGLRVRCAAQRRGR